jgi:type III pantothenate kinase
MTYVIDIGNTSVKLYKMDECHVVQAMKFDEKALTALSESKFNVELIIASVVPKKTEEITALIKKYGLGDPLVITHEHYKGFKSKYLDLSELGIDRLCNAAYAVRNFKKNTIVIDLGSAVTFDIINGRGEFEGGMILPGIRTQFKSLSKHTALLPDLIQHDNDLFIGRSTEECIRSGVQNGIAGICNDFVKEISNRFTSRVQVILSGGDAEFISKLVDFDYKIEIFTVPIGAYIISRMVK